MYSAIAVYALAMLAYAAETAGRVTSKALVTAGPPVDADPSGRWYRIGAIGTSLTVTGFALSVGAVLTRGLAAQRVPWGNMYEFAMVGAVAAGAAYLTLLYRRPVRALGVWIVGIVLLVLGLAVTVLYTPVDALVPVLNSYWLVIHVAAAITGGGVFTVGAVATVLFLIKSRSEVAAEGFDNPRARRYATTLPSSKSLDQVAHAAHMFAFPIWTFAVIAGAIWAENAWGRYWGWDPKETWAFITWVFYAAYLHAQATAGWRGRKASWFALAGYAAFLFNFFGVNLWISGLHSYAGV
ncbi:c-type cytochrome biogenesis protein CcsB [Nocardioides sp.]|uniref:c-type cytochrome biogenesis protein CcsB n=1 Tax=Nocardioides sp. TaxID=35761 RepID=UPI003D0A8A90